MATPEQRWQSLVEEATCPTCLGYFKDPVFVQCGHTFCTPCITRYWEKEGLKGGPYPCPQCRETSPTDTLRPNRQLASIVQILAMGPPVVTPREGPRGEGHLMCREHDEKLKLFCGEDRIPICVICRESREHQDHKVLPVREAAQEYKNKFQSFLDNVKMKLENIIGLQNKEETRVTYLEGNFKSQRERIASVFDNIQQFLDEEKCRHLNDLEEKEKRALQEIRKKVTEFDEQQALFRSLITEMESKSQQPDVELLKDAKGMLNRCENLNSLKPDPEPSNEYGKQTEECVVEEKERDLEMKIIESLEWRWAQSFQGGVTLDHDTAHRRLVLSEDGRSVSLGDIEQELPDTPKRFNPIINVLGREKLSSGRHYWEVDVGDKTAWSLGVCDDSVSRKGAITRSPERGYWAVWLRDGEYEALTSPRIPLTPSLPLRIVGLFLDYEAGRLCVYDVPGRSLLFTFSEASFPSTLRPYFCPGFRDGGKNAGALTILPVTGGE